MKIIPVEKIWNPCLLDILNTKDSANADTQESITCLLVRDPREHLTDFMSSLRSTQADFIALAKTILMNRSRRINIKLP